MKADGTRIRRDFAIEDGRLRMDLTNGRGFVTSHYFDWRGALVGLVRFGGEGDEVVVERSYVRRVATGPRRLRSRQERKRSNFGTLETRMQADVFTEWDPVANAPRRMNVAHLSQDADGLHIALQELIGEGPIFVFTFEAPIAYRNINESYRLRTWMRDDRPRTSSLYTVASSTMVSWIRKESGGVLDGVQLEHYAFITDEDCIDVISEAAPSVAVRDA